ATRIFSPHRASTWTSNPASFLDPMRPSYFRSPQLLHGRRESLLEATRGDTDYVGFLQRWFGYCLTGDIKEHALVFIYGPGGTGKTTLVKTMQEIFGSYARSAPMDAFTISRGDRHPTELAMMMGKRLITASETERGRSWAESRIKQLTGGDRIPA